MAEEEQKGMGELRALWPRARPTRKDYAEVVQELQAAKLFWEESVFERNPHVPITYQQYFKPPADAFLCTLRSKGQRSAKD